HSDETLAHEDEGLFGAIAVARFEALQAEMNKELREVGVLGIAAALTERAGKGVERSRALIDGEQLQPVVEVRRRPVAINVVAQNFGAADLREHVGRVERRRRALNLFAGFDARVLLLVEENVAEQQRAVVLYPLRQVRLAHPVTHLD